MKNLVLGIDGGGTKTDLALADMEGKIIKKVKTGPASLRNTGVDQSCENILEGVRSILPSDGNIISTFVGLPAFQEEYGEKEGYIKDILSAEITGNIKIGSDQLVAFKSGTDKSQGIVVIAGTGGVVAGFKRDKIIKVSGWGYFGDEGSGFWTGIKAYRAITKELDKRGPETLITKMLFNRWDVSNGNELNKKIYSKPMKYIPELSVLVDYAQREGDQIAQSILEEASEELFLSVKGVIDLVDLEVEFPIILVGGMFKSKFLEDKLIKKIKKYKNNIDIIKPQKEPVLGAVKLAILSHENK